MVGWRSAVLEWRRGLHLMSFRSSNVSRIVRGRCFAWFLDMFDIS